MAAYEFKLTLQGEGETEEQAWTDAVDAFCADPGEPQEIVNLDDDLPVFTIILKRPEYATDGYGLDTYPTTVSAADMDVAIAEAKAECCAADGRDGDDEFDRYVSDTEVIVVIKGKAEFLL